MVVRRPQARTGAHARTARGSCLCIPGCDMSLLTSNHDECPCTCQSWLQPPARVAAPADCRHWAPLRVLQPLGTSACCSHWAPRAHGVRPHTLRLCGTGTRAHACTHLDAHVLVLMVGVDLEAVDGLQELGLLVQELLQHELLLVLGQLSIHDLVRLLHARSVTGCCGGTRFGCWLQKQQAT